MQEPEPKQEAINLDPHYISVEQAIGNMNSAMSQLYTGTRATRGYTIQTLKGSNLQRTGTRSDGTELPEDLVYIVNFDNDEGFAVLAGDDRLENVIAITERGNLDITDIIDGEEGEIEADTSIVVAPNAVIGTMIKGYINTEIRDISREIDNGIINDGGLDDDPNPPTGGGGGGGSNPPTSVGPLLKTKWGQGGPFNNDCPVNTSAPLYYIHPDGYKLVDGNGNYIREHNPAGCVAIAVAQIVAHYGSPSLPSYSIGGKTWEEVRSHNFIRYYEVLYNGNPISWLSKQDSIMGHIVAIIVRRIGSDLGMDYGVSSSTSDPWAAQNYLSNKAYTATLYFLNYKGSKVKSELAASRPVILFGGRWFKGHAWIVDGYKYANNKLLFHINWGWANEGDGYFNAGVFDPRKRVEQEDNEIIEGPNTGNFDWYMSMLTVKR